MIDSKQADEKNRYATDTLRDRQISSYKFSYSPWTNCHGSSKHAAQPNPGKPLKPQSPCQEIESLWQQQMIVRAEIIHTAPLPTMPPAIFAVGFEMVGWVMLIWGPLMALVGRVLGEEVVALLGRRAEGGSLERGRGISVTYASLVRSSFLLSVG